MVRRLVGRVDPPRAGSPLLFIFPPEMFLVPRHSRHFAITTITINNNG